MQICKLSGLELRNGDYEVGKCLAESCWDNVENLETRLRSKKDFGVG
ncbi:hypothetical protein SAMN06298216_3392 [Spirosomataceae bacterium TFI 002]|nr:hypothetical protein SAMN06298216_3392 [Spirosomataceae bacterium TFI 002]